jgi:hypothetical protein
VKRWQKIAALAASHLAVFGTAAAVTGGALVRAEFQRAEADPLTHLGMRFEAPPEARDSFGSRTDHVAAASAQFGPQTQQVIQLAAELRINDMTGATRTCGELGWRDCEPATLSAMQKALLR